MTTTVIKTIGSTGDFSTPQLWEDGAPADLTTAEKSPANTFSGTFVQGESLTFTGSGATGKFLHTDNSTYIIYGLITGNPASGDSVAGATASCILTSSTPDDTGVIWQGQCQNQEFSGAETQVTITGSTASATAYKEFTTVAGASFRDNTNVQTNALRYNSANGCGITGTSDTTTTINLQEAGCRMSKIQVAATGAGARAVATTAAAASGFLDFSILEGTYDATGANLGVLGVNSNTFTTRNCVIILRTSVADHVVGVSDKDSIAFYNCTIVAADD